MGDVAALVRRGARRALLLAVVLALVAVVLATTGILDRGGPPRPSAGPAAP
ncbi:hypothetical protein GUY44_19165, partial [Pimelobacter simplex]|nr:hypothetical protein [Pimelobacter simplex]